jgi:hypothetical protein
MAEMATGTSSGPLYWFIKICKGLYGKRSFIWGTLVLGILLNVFATLLFITWPWTTALKQTPTVIGWAFQNLWTIIIIGCFLVLLWIIVFLGNRLTIGPPQKELSRRYLKNIVLETELLTLRGVPAGLISESVRIDEVFIPLQLRPNRPRADYPLTDKELEQSDKMYNRFLITSRVAGYDHAAFPDYLHYTIAALTSEKIDYFIPRWCRANVLRARGLSSNNSIERDGALRSEIERRQQELSAAVNANESIHELAENPLLLTLFAVMQQNSIVLPQRRVELYNTVTRTLLENRNIAKNLDTIPEILAIKYLGPLAFQMQDAGNSFARRGDVIDALEQAIGGRGPGSTSRDEAEKFLTAIRARGGLFVQRTGDYFGFMHRTFQEYFVARYILNQIKLKQKEWIAKLVERAQRKDELWREPFLLAVAYQSGENEQVADEIIRTLLQASAHAAVEERLRDTLLAAECLIEAKPLTIDPLLEEQIADMLFQTYETAQRQRKFGDCQRIEGVVQRRLLVLVKEDNCSQFLAARARSISASGRIARQKAVLTLLAMIAQSLQACPSFVFDMLVPPLRVLAGLPEIDKFQPASNIPAPPDLNVVDLALTALFATL